MKIYINEKRNMVLEAEHLADTQEILTILGRNWFHTDNNLEPQLKVDYARRLHNYAKELYLKLINEK